MPADWLEDDEVLRLNAGAIVTLLGVITLCARGRSDGRISAAQLHRVASLTGKPRASIRELIDKKVLIPWAGERSEFGRERSEFGRVEPSNDGERPEFGREAPDKVRSSPLNGPTKSGGEPSKVDGEPEFVLRLAGKWLAYTSVAAAQNPSPNDEGRSASRARPPARVKKQTDIHTDRQTTTSRPASPDGRDVVVARAAPLAPSDATRHAPGVFGGPVREPDENPVVSLQSPSAESRPALKSRLSELEARQKLANILDAANGKVSSADDISPNRNGDANSGGAGE